MSSKLFISFCVILIFHYHYVCSLIALSGARQNGWKFRNSVNNRQLQQQLDFKLYLSKNTVSVFNAPADNQNEQFLEWEQEEVERYRQNLEDEVIALKSDSDFGDQPLPDYMLKMLGQLNSNTDKNIVNLFNDEPVPASKLPILAVIGRPNTGKSTLVNKLTNSYKVRTLELFLCSDTKVLMLLLILLFYIGRFHCT